MNDLILRFLEDKVYGDTVANVRLSVTQGFGLDDVRTEERLDEMVEEGDLACLHAGCEPRYAINPIPQEKTIDKLIIDFMKSQPEGSKTEDIVKAVADLSLGKIKTEHVLDILEDLIDDELILVDLDDSRMLLAIP